MLSKVAACGCNPPPLSVFSSYLWNTYPFTRVEKLGTVACASSPVSGRGRGGSLDLLASRPSLLGTLQASERLSQIKRWTEPKGNNWSCTLPTNAHSYTHTHLHTCTYTQMHTLVHAQAHLHTYTHRCTHTCTHACTHAHLHIHTYRCTHIVLKDW